MKLSELIISVREEFLDDVPDMEDQDDSASAADLARMIRWAGEAERQACKHGDCKRIYDEETAAICTITLVESTRSYALDSRIVLLDADPFYSGESVQLPQTTVNILDRDYTGWRSYDEGEPAGFYIKGRKLYLDRAPSSDEAGDTLTLPVWREPLKVPALHDAPEIDAQHHWHLGHWMAYRYFMMPNAPTKDDKRSQMHRKAFEAYFGPEVRGDVLQHQLENPRYVRHDAGRGFMDTWHTRDRGVNPNDW